MVRKSNPNRHSRKSGASRAAAQYAARSHEQYIAQLLADDAYKEQQKAFRANFKKQREDILSRTIYVTNVLNLKEERNLQALQSFMAARYGTVEFCNRVENDRQFPPARIRFRSASDASKVFGGRPLKDVQGSVQVPCPLGCKAGSISVLPSRPYADMMKALRSSLILSARQVSPWGTGAQTSMT
jgi:hypothetical protein